MLGEARRPPTSLWSVPFVICVVLLGTTTLALKPVTRYMKVTLTKKPIPLRASLGLLHKQFGPYRFVEGHTLDSAVINTLGTDQYIHWIIEDTSVEDQRSPLRVAHLFITYYTGQPDAVPHTPDQCYKGSGYQTVGAENTSLWIESLADAAEVPVRMVTFAKSNIFSSDEMSVVYTFHCNGKFVASREGVRTAANNPLDKYAYFSKVEVNFGWKSARPRFPSGKDSIAASEKFFSYLLPLLVNEHWPDWSAVKASAGDE